MVSQLCSFLQYIKSTYLKLVHIHAPLMIEGEISLNPYNFFQLKASFFLSLISRLYTRRLKKKKTLAISG